MKKLLLPTIILFASVTAFAQSFPILYTFDSVKTTSGTTDPSPLPTVTGVSCGAFSATGTPANSLAAARFDFADWALGSVGGTNDTLYSGMTGSVNTAEYYEVTLTPTGGYTMSLDTLKFSFERSGTGVRTYAVRSSMDGFAANLTAVYLPPNNNVEVETGNIFFLRHDATTVQNRSNIVLGGASFTAMTGPVTFRFYAWNAEGAGGTFSIDNVRFKGNATLSTGITEKTNNDLEIYPNPSNNGIFTVEPSSTNIKTSVKVYNVLGNLLLKQEINQKEQIDLSAQPNGSYFIRIENAQGNCTKKLIINK